MNVEEAKKIYLDTVYSEIESVLKSTQPSFGGGCKIQTDVYFDSLTDFAKEELLKNGFLLTYINESVYYGDVKDGYKRKFLFFKKDKYRTEYRMVHLIKVSLA
jgi:hypothetical protein